MRSRRYSNWLIIVIGIIELFVYSGYSLGMFVLYPIYRQHLECNSSLDGVNVSCRPRDKKEKKKGDMSYQPFVYLTLAWVVCEAFLVPLITALATRFKLGRLGQKAIALVLSSAGSLLFAFVTRVTPGSISWTLLYLAGILSLTGGTFNEVLNQKLALLEPRWSGLISSLMAGAYDASMAMPALIYQLSDEMSLQWSFLLLTTVGTLIMLMSILGSRLESVRKLGQSTSKEPTPCLELSEFQPKNNRPNCVEEGNSLVVSKPPTEVVVPSIKSSLLSKQYIGYTSWNTLSGLCFTIFLSTIPTSISHDFEKDPETGMYVTVLFPIISYSGIIINPMVGLLIDKLKRHYIEQVPRTNNAKSTNDAIPATQRSKYQLVATICLLIGIVNLCLSILMFFTSFGFYLGAFICFVVYRALFFTNLPNVISLLFPVEHFSLLLSCDYSIGGLFVLLSYALVQMPLRVLEYLNCALSSMLLLGPIMTLVYLRCNRLK